MQSLRLCNLYEDMLSFLKSTNILLQKLISTQCILRETFNVQASD